MDTINGTIIATPEITSKVLANATVIDYQVTLWFKKDITSGITLVMG